MTINFGIFHDRDQSVVTSYDCHGCDGCHDGTGCVSVVTFKESAWSMNVANANAGMLLSALGIDVTDGGSINANVLLMAIDRTPASLLMRRTVEVGNIITCGVDVDRATRYLTKLREIATEAARREELVGWG